MTDLLTVVTDGAFTRSRATRAVALDIFKAPGSCGCTGLLHNVKSHGISGLILSFVSIR